MYRWLGVLGLALGLGCAGVLGPDPAQIVQLREALRLVNPEQIIPFMVQGSVEAGSVRFGCAEALEAWSHVDPSQRSTILAAAMADPTSFCPQTCGGEALFQELATLAPEERMPRVIAVCDALGPDPLFAEELRPLRPYVPPLEYLMLRELTVIALAADPQFSEVVPALGMGLVLAGAPSAEGATWKISGSASLPEAEQERVRQALAACGGPGAVRIVFGQAHTATTPCVQGVVSSLTGTGLLDITWH